MSIYDEALEELQDYVNEYGMDYYATKHFPKTITALKQAKQLEQDVKRYFELNNLPDDKYTIIVVREHNELLEKLLKVGKSE